MLSDEIPVSHGKTVQTIGKFWCNETLNKKSVDCLRMIEPYYTEEKSKEILYPVIKKRFDISCRTLEYTCVNYAKKNNVVFFWMVDGEKILVNLADEYNRWLDQWNRPNFDFFRRYTRIYFKYQGEILYTTVGQAHILYWADRYGIIE